MANGHVISDSTSRFLGDHRAYLNYAMKDGRTQFQLIISKPDRIYYHLEFDFYGPGKAGTLKIGEQHADQFGTGGIGFCRMTAAEKTS